MTVGKMTPWMISLSSATHLLLFLFLLLLQALSLAKSLGFSFPRDPLSSSFLVKDSPLSSSSSSTRGREVPSSHDAFLIVLLYTAALTDMRSLSSPSAEAASLLARQFHEGEGKDGPSGPARHFSSSSAPCIFQEKIKQKGSKDTARFRTGSEQGGGGEEEAEEEQDEAQGERTRQRWAPATGGVFFHGREMKTDREKEKERAEMLFEDVIRNLNSPDILRE